MLEIGSWMEKFVARAQETFGDNLHFAGLQGSYGRGEATEESDIDVVVILERMALEELEQYGAMLADLEEREKVCGFFSDRGTLLSWDRADLFQFYYDTIPVLGSLDYLRPLIRPEDVRRAILTGACNLYHMGVHNVLHRGDGECVKGLYKGAGFVMQAVHFERTGDYVRQKAALIGRLPPEEGALLEAALGLRGREVGTGEVAALSGPLLDWAARLIARYGGSNA